MDWDALYHFFFETYAGIGAMVGISLVVCILACVFWEFRTRRIYKNHEKDPDAWSLFDDDDEEEEA